MTVKGNWNVDIMDTEKIYAMKGKIAEKYDTGFTLICDNGHYNMGWIG